MAAPRSTVADAVSQLIISGPPDPDADPQTRADALLDAPAVRSLLVTVLDTDAYAATTGQDLVTRGALGALPALRRLRTSLSASVATFAGLLHDLIAGFDPVAAGDWHELADGLRRSTAGERRLVDALRAGPHGAFWHELADRLVHDDPHARFPTSPYRWSDGHVLSSDDGHIVEAVMTSSTSTSIRVVEGVLDPAEPLLRDLYAANGRCVAVVDRNVEQRWGARIRAYFAHHDIELHTLVYRAMEVDKGIRTVERMLGDFKQLGVTRAEPVLVVGGGVLTDTAGLACALYHRNTPYVMLSTSLVAGIDAGPSPRTCCDGFGYKNLIGAYHAPIVSITDRTFFATMQEGWLRHGVAEIIKMAVVKDAALFDALEQAGPGLVTTRFGTTDSALAHRLAPAARAILAGAMRSYVEAEYDNLYETHQARPHAYGHTWSPGVEIPAGLLHGHAVAIGMGFGALVSHRAGWIDEPTLHRILTLMSDFGLSLWHDVLDDVELVWRAQQKIEQKRGGQLVAPLPRGGIGSCGYLEDLSRDELAQALAAYRELCATYPRQGVGIDPLCRDVGLEDPSTVAPDPVPGHNAHEDPDSTPGDTAGHAPDDADDDRDDLDRPSARPAA
jgi:3-dehydroquinate synthetase